MKLSKKKVFVLALAVCLIATLSMGTLAWFTDQDSVKNDFHIAGSEDENPDNIFSVDVWEGTDPENPEQEGMKFKDILPGDELDKVAHVKNTGSYKQYIRVKITVSNASWWQKVYKANLIPVTEFVNVDEVAAWDDVYGISTYLEEDNFVYYLYYKTLLQPTTNNDIVVFNKAYISEYLTVEQAEELEKLQIGSENKGFTIKVTADAVQTEHVGTNVYEAFETVGMATPLNTVEVADYAALKAALAEEKEFIVLTNNISMNSNRTTGKTAELYLNHFTLETPAGIYVDGEAYGLDMAGDLTISGHGILEVNTLHINVAGTFTNCGAEITGQGEIR